jgi:tetratricopeptide (TPR) repeat protein
MWVLLIAPKLPRIDPLLTGARAVTRADLPAKLQQQSDDVLRQHLADSLANITKGEQWWRARCSSDEAREVVLLGRLLHNNQATARGLLWFTNKSRGDEPLGFCLPYIDSAIACAEASGLSIEEDYGRICRGRELERAGLYHAAAREFEQCAPRLEAQHEYRLASRAFNELGSVQGRHLGAEAAAAASYRRSVQLGRQVPASNVVPVLTLAGHNSESCGDFAAAEQALADALSLARTSGHTDRFYRSLNSLASYYAGTAQPAKAQPLLREAWELLPEMAETSTVFVDLSPYETYLYRSGNTDELQEKLSQVIARCTQLQSNPKRGPPAARCGYDLLDLAQHARMDKADYYYRVADYADALQCAQQVIDYCKSTGCTEWDYRALITKSQALLGQGRNEDALAVLDQAALESATIAVLKMKVDPGIELLRARAQTALGRCGDAQATLDCAKETGRRLSTVLPAEGDYRLQHAYGLLYAKQGRTRQALDAYREAFALLTSPAWREMWAYPIDPESLDVLGAVGAEYAALLRQAGRGAEAGRVEVACAKASEALKFIRDGLPCAPATRAALWAYLGTLTAEETLRGHLREVGETSQLQILRPQSPGGPPSLMPRLWLASWSEHRRLKRELSARLKRAEARLAQALAALCRADAHVAGLVSFRVGFQDGS